MKTIIINGSPRKNWNTAQLLKEVQKGAESVGNEVEYIELYDLKFTGCRSCLACKRKGISEPCKCYWKDELSPVLEKILQADRIIIGTPIYYSEPTGLVRSFLERITFPAMSYSTYQSVFNGKIDVDVFLTMNAPMQFYKQNYERRFQEYFAPFRFLNGQIRLIPVCAPNMIWQVSARNTKKQFMKRSSRQRWNLLSKSVRGNSCNEARIWNCKMWVRLLSVFTEYALQRM